MLSAPPGPAGPLWGGAAEPSDPAADRELCVRALAATYAVHAAAIGPFEGVGATLRLLDATPSAPLRHHLLRLLEAVVAPPAATGERGQVASRIRCAPTAEVLPCPSRLRRLLPGQEVNFVRPLLCPEPRPGSLAGPAAPLLQAALAQATPARRRRRRGGLMPRPLWRRAGWSCWRTCSPVSGSWGCSFLVPTGEALQRVGSELLVYTCQ